MSAQDAQDIVQMNSLSGGIPVVDGGKKKSSLIWIVLGCVVVGVGLGVFVYQQSLAPAPKPSATPRASKAPASVAPVPSAVTPTTNEVSAVANTITFPKTGKLRIFHDLNNIQLVVQIVINGSTKTITLPNKTVSTAAPMNYADSSFEVTAGSTGTVTAYLNSTSGPKLVGWVNPADPQHKDCGVNGAVKIDLEPQLAYATSLLGGESIFQYQCWEDNDPVGEFNDLYMLWTYVPSNATPTPTPSAAASVSPTPSSTATPTPSASATATPTPTPSPSHTPTPSPSPSKTPSPSPSQAAATTVTPTPSTRAAMPDTTDGVPVTGVFEVTVGTVSVGILLLVLGLIGLLAL